MMSLLRPPLSALADLIYPPHCAGCGVRQPPGQWICAPCEAKVRRLNSLKCPICSFSCDGAPDAFVCPNCRDDIRYFEFAIAVMKSDGLMRDLIHRFKYGREFHLRRLLGDWLSDAFEDDRLAHYGEARLIPVPLHPARLRERGFNQSEALAEWVGRRRGLKVERALRRRRYTITQTHFDRRDRMRNLREAFALRQNADVKDKCFLLVDDVLTTGSTLNECARVLLAGGARSVRAIVVARG